MEYLRHKLDQQYQVIQNIMQMLQNQEHIRSNTVPYHEHATMTSVSMQTDSDNREKGKSPSYFLFDKNINLTALYCR